MKKYAIIGICSTTTPAMLEKDWLMWRNTTLTPTPQTKLFKTINGARRYIDRETVAGTMWSLAILTIEEAAQ
jgi:hypothetical protein